MKKIEKDDVQVLTAVGMLGVGVALVIAGFIVSPTGEVSDSVLWFFAQCLIYAGSIFGISIYASKGNASLPSPTVLSEGDKQTEQGRERKTENKTQNLPPARK